MRMSSFKIIAVIRALCAAAAVSAAAADPAPDSRTEWRALAGRVREGDAEAMVEMGDRLHAGRGVRKDEAKAIEYWAQAALRGHVGAMRRVALDLRGGSDGVSADPARARTLLQRAAQAGDGPARLELAAMYDAGRGVERDAAEAVRWLRLGADAGDIECRMRLAAHLDQGRGTARDPAAAHALYLAAAEAGHAPAWNLLGIRHAEGRGTPVDHAEATRCFARAARAGQAGAERNLEALIGRTGFLERRRLRRIAADPDNAP